MNIVRAYLEVLRWYGLPLLAVGLIVLLLVDGARFLTKKIDPAASDHAPMTITGVFIGTLISLAVGSIPLFDREGLSLDADWLRGLALVAILMVPAVLAMIGLRRPAALLVAGIVSLPMPMMSFSFLLFPMLIPAVLYLVAYGRAAKVERPRAPAPVIASSVFVLIVLAFVSLFVNEDPRCYEIIKQRDGTTFERSVPAVNGGSVMSSSGNVIESGCSSDTVTPIEAGLSLSLVALAVASAAYLSGPRRSAHLALDVYS